MPRKPISNVVVISDLHCGCQLGLCPPGGIRLDEGGAYHPNKVQRRLWDIWLNKFWKDFVPTATKGEPYAVVCNGDAIDGTHHSATHQISHNLEDQSEIAYRCLAPIVDKTSALMTALSIEVITSNKVRPRMVNRINPSSINIDYISNVTRL